MKFSATTGESRRMAIGRVEIDVGAVVVVRDARSRDEVLVLVIAGLLRNPCMMSGSF